MPLLEGLAKRTGVEASIYEWFCAEQIPPTEQLDETALSGSGLACEDDSCDWRRRGIASPF